MDRPNATTNEPPSPCTSATSSPHSQIADAALLALARVLGAIAVAHCQAQQGGTHAA